MTRYYSRQEALRVIGEARQITVFQVGARFMTRKEIRKGIEAGRIAAERIAWAIYKFVPVELLTCVDCGATGSEEADGFLEGPECPSCHLKALGEMVRI